MGKGDWEDDRINGSDNLETSIIFNKKNGQKQYKTIEQRAEFYKWFQNTESRGYDTKCRYWYWIDICFCRIFFATKISLIMFSISAPI
jgi:hypothetical protein